MTTPTRLFSEAGEAAAVVSRQVAANAGMMRDLAARLITMQPTIVFTCARGSSDHAATFAKYLIETRLGIPTLSQAPSLSSIYGKPLLHMAGAPFIVISQSGRSPDLLLSAQAAKAAGALVIALVNDTASPLAALADVVVPLHAGPETSIAATKSYIASLSALVHLVAAWDSQQDLAAALPGLPDLLAQSWALDWRAGVDMLAHATSLFVLGRGLTLGIAQEAALKCKETCAIHAEAFSIAEVAHGPMALIRPGFPVLAFPPVDGAATGIDRTVALFVERGARVAVAGVTLPGAITLPILPGMHPALAPIAMVQSLYALIDALARRRGLDPDHPPMLNKVTRTL